MPIPQWGREPVTIVEIDEDYCTRTYGVAPCTAAIGVTGTDKCYNRFKTCQSADNYNRTTQTIRFCAPFEALPLEWNAIPSVMGVTMEPTRLNIAGGHDASGALGTRGKAKVTFNDHPDGDIKTDPYLADRTHDPFTTGTFWTKWLARNPYYMNRVMRIYQGYLGESIGSMKMSTFVIDKISGPDARGNVTVTGVDILRLADDKAAKAPRESTGELLYAITGASTQIDIIEAADGDYPAPGTVRIGDSLINYTGSSYSLGVTTLTGLTFNVYGSTMADSDAGEAVQWCLVYTDAMPHDVAYDLLTNYGDVAAAYIPKTDWDAEADIWLPQFRVTSVISKPEGVTSLLTSLMQECMFYVWWDERVQEVKLRAVRPATDTIPLLTSDGDELEGTAAVSEDTDMRVSRVYLYYQPRNWADDLSKTETYKKVRLSLDAASESVNEYRSRQTKVILCRWIDTDGKVLNAGIRFLAKYRDATTFLTLRVDAANRDIWTADVVDVALYQFVDFLGRISPKRFQVISAKEAVSGEVIEYKMQSFEFAGKFAYWMADDAPDFIYATETEKLTGAWWSGVDGKMPDGSDGYTWQ